MSSAKEAGAIAGNVRTVSRVDVTGTGSAGMRTRTFAPPLKGIRNEERNKVSSLIDNPAEKRRRVVCSVSVSSEKSGAARFTERRNDER